MYFVFIWFLCFALGSQPHCSGATSGSVIRNHSWRCLGDHLMVGIELKPDCLHAKPVVQSCLVLALPCLSLHCTQSRQEYVAGVVHSFERRLVFHPWELFSNHQFVVITLLSVCSGPSGQPLPIVSLLSLEKTEALGWDLGHCLCQEELGGGKMGAPSIPQASQELTCVCYQMNGVLIFSF